MALKMALKMVAAVVKHNKCGHCIVVDQVSLKESLICDLKT